MEAEKWQDLKGKFSGVDDPEYEKALNEGKFDEAMNDPQYMEAIRNESFFEKPNEDPPDVGPPPEQAPAPESEETQVPAENTDPETKEDKDTSEDPIWKQKGFESPEEMANKFADLNSLLEKKQEQINRFNTERGQEGLKAKKELIELQKKYEDLEHQLNSKNTDLNTDNIELPTMPEYPVAEDGDFSSEEYQHKLRDYRLKIDDYNRKMQNFGNTSLKAISETQKLKQLLAEQDAKLQNVSQFTADQRKNLAQQQAEAAWSETLGQIDGLQKEFPELKTSRSFNEINDLIVKVGSEAAYTQLSAADVAAHKQIVDTVTSYRDFDESGNIVADSKPRFSSLRSAHLDKLVANGKFDEYLKNARQDGAVEGRKQVIDKMQELDSGPVTLPPGGEQQDIVRASTQEEDLELLKHYTTPEGDAELKTNPAKRREYLELMDRNGLGDAVPNSYREELQNLKE